MGPELGDKPEIDGLASATTPLDNITKNKEIALTAKFQFTLHMN
jgi:hypothetical protein